MNDQGRHFSFGCQWLNPYVHSLLLDPFLGSLQM